MQQKEKNTGGQSVRTPFVLIAIVAVVSLVGAVWYLQSRKSAEPEAGGAANPPASQEEEPVLVASGTNILNPQAELASGVSAIPSKIPPAGIESRPRGPEPSAYTKRLMEILSGLDSKTPMTPEKAAEWKQAMEQLVKEGAGAIPAIQQFLEKNEDLRFNYGGGTNLLGESTLRTAMIKTLAGIQGPESLALQAQILQMTADPAEIALLARQLDRQAPEQYRAMAIEAAQAALEMARAGKLPDRDVGPLFSILQQYGGENMVDYLKGSMGNWSYYSAIALADLPNGAGLPALVDMVANPESTGRTSRMVALWMLAQEAESELARTTLLEQTQKASIPCPLWMQLSSILSGNIFQIGNATAEGRIPAGGEQSWILRQGNQSFYSTPSPTGLPLDYVNQRVAFIEQLIAANAQCPEAIGWLQKAKADLLARVSGR